jgi:hypothetical protein
VRLHPDHSSRTPGRLSRAIRWKSPLRQDLNFASYVLGAVIGVLVGSAAGDTWLGLVIGAGVGSFGPGLIAEWAEHRGTLPGWAQARPNPTALNQPGMGIYASPPPEDEIGPIYAGRADQAPLQIWFKRRQIRARRRHSD